MAPPGLSRGPDNSGFDVGKQEVFIWHIVENSIESHCIRHADDLWEATLQRGQVALPPVGMILTATDSTPCQQLLYATGFDIKSKGPWILLGISKSAAKAPTKSLILEKTKEATDFVEICFAQTLWEEAGGELRMSGFHWAGGTAVLLGPPRSRGGPSID